MTGAVRAVIFAIVGILWKTIEIGLGILKPVDAGTLPDLLWTLFQKLRSRKEPPTMSANPNARSLNLNIDGPTYDAMGVVVDSVKKLASGEKPQQVVGEELGQAMASLTTASQIPGDLAADRLSVLYAISIRAAELADAIVGSRALSPAPASAPTTNPK